MCRYMLFQLTYPAMQDMAVVGVNKHPFIYVHTYIQTRVYFCSVFKNTRPYAPNKMDTLNHGCSFCV